MSEIAIRITGPELTALRLKVFRRDAYRCIDCGRSVCDSPHAWFMMQAQMSHVIGRGAGGDDSEENCVTKCGGCHMELEHNPKSVRGK